MIRPEILAIPCFMLLDYYLTLAGKVLRQRSSYDRYFQLGSYELNPVFKQDIDRLRWFSPRHLALVLIVTGVYAWISILSQAGDSSAENTYQFAMGLGIVYFSLVASRHIKNLLTLWHFTRNNPGASGQVTMNQPLLLQLSQFEWIGMLAVFVAIAFWTRSAFILGGCAAVVVLILNHAIWLRHWKSRDRNSLD
jgi:hypothetical protein